MKRIISMLLLMVFVAGCSTFNMDKFKWNKKDGVTIEKVETQKKCQSCH